IWYDTKEFNKSHLKGVFFMNTNKKFYQKNWFIYLCMLLFPPAGVILMWVFNKESSTKFKGIISAVAAIWFIFLLCSPSSTPTDTEKTVSNEDSLIAESTSVESETFTEFTNDSQIEQESITTLESNSEISIDNSADNTLQSSGQGIEKSTELFEQVYVPYANREKAFAFYAVKTFVSTLGYEIEITEPSEDVLGEIKIIDTNGDYVYLTFYPVNDIETITLVNYHRAETNCEVSMENYSADSSPQLDSFATHIIGEAPVEVTGTDEQRNFLFNRNVESESSSTPESDLEISTDNTVQSSDQSANTSNDTEVSTTVSNNFDTYNNTDQQNATAQYVLNTNTKKIHIPSCSSVPTISPKNYSTSNLSISELEAQGYQRCGRCLK
ncbi:MAG: hypothetical protein K2G55_03640, partial [Lachnospiraceae bacterium]|nr:hypothetical protein [Lachnospiraceae bacterium]